MRGIWCKCYARLQSHSSGYDSRRWIRGHEQKQLSRLGRLPGNEEGIARNRTVVLEAEAQ